MTWTAPQAERPVPGLIPGDREALEARLDYQRATLLVKCAGLTAEQLKRRAIPPSQLSLLGLVRHMTEVERWWFRIHAADTEMAFMYATQDSYQVAFTDVDSADAETDLARFRQEVAAARSAAGGKQLDEVVRSHGHHPERVRNIRWIYVHMIEEYARHNGHADLLREVIDGATGE